MVRRPSRRRRGRRTRSASATSTARPPRAADDLGGDRVAGVANQAPRRRSAPRSGSGRATSGWTDADPRVSGERRRARATRRGARPRRRPGAMAAATVGDGGVGHGQHEAPGPRRRPRPGRTTGPSGPSTRPPAARERHGASEPPARPAPMTRTSKAVTWMSPFQIRPGTGACPVATLSRRRAVRHGRPCPRRRPPSRRRTSVRGELGQRCEDEAAARHIRGCGISRSGSSTVTPSIQRMSTSRVRGPHRTSRTRPAAASSRRQTPSSCARVEVGVELDDHVQVAALVGAADRVGLVHVGHGDQSGERSDGACAGAPLGRRGSNPAPRNARVIGSRRTRTPVDADVERDRRAELADGDGHRGRCGRRRRARRRRRAPPAVRAGRGRRR